MAKVSFYFRAHCCSMRCTRNTHSHTRIYRCKIALLTPTSWDTLYAYTDTREEEGGQLQLIVRLKVDRANEENAERGRVIWAKSEKALWRATPSKKPAFRFCPRSFSPRWGSAYLALRQRRRRHRASSAAAPNTSLCSICFQYHLNNDAEHNNQIDVRRIVKTCTHTHTVTVTFTYTHIYLPSLLGICQVIQSGCELTRVYYFSIYSSTWYLNSWISESVVQWMKVNFTIPKVA